MYICRHTDLALFLIGLLLEPFHEPPLLLLGLGLLNFLHKAGRKYSGLSVQQTCPPPIWTLLNDLLGKRGEEEEKGGERRKEGRRRGGEGRGGSSGRKRREGKKYVEACQLMFYILQKSITR